MANNQEIKFCEEGLTLIFGFNGSGKSSYFRILNMMANADIRYPVLQKAGITDFKDHMREYMYYEQNCRCAYCRIELPIACCFLQREHIIPKAPHPKWMFEPRNLCFACDRCNNFKGDEEVLRNQYAVAYPTDSKDFLIVNPFLDKYSDHIELRMGSYMLGGQRKGVLQLIFANSIGLIWLKNGQRKEWKRKILIPFVLSCCLCYHHYLYLMPKELKLW